MSKKSKSKKSKSAKDVEFAVKTGGLPMLQVRMKGGRPVIAADPGKKSRKVTILTVKQVYARGETSEMTLAFSSREHALHAINAHTSNPNAVTTLNIRTLDVIQ